MREFQILKNKAENLFDKEKKAFNQMAHNYKIRICNRNNLVVFAIRDNDSMIIYPTEVSVGDVVVDERSNRFYIAKTIEINDFNVSIGDDTKNIGVVRLIFNNDMLKNLTISNYVQSKNEINANVTVSGNEGSAITIQAGDNTINSSISLNLEIHEYWKLLKNELVYSYNNSDFTEYIDEVEKAFAEKRQIKENITNKAKSKALIMIRNFIIDFGAKFLSEYLSKVSN